MEIRVMRTLEREDNEAMRQLRGGGVSEEGVVV